MIDTSDWCMKRYRVRHRVLGVSISMQHVVCISMQGVPLNIAVYPKVEVYSEASPGLLYIKEDMNRSLPLKEKSWSHNNSYLRLSYSLWSAANFISVVLNRLAKCTKMILVLISFALTRRGLKRALMWTISLIWVRISLTHLVLLSNLNGGSSTTFCIYQFYYNSIWCWNRWLCASMGEKLWSDCGRAKLRKGELPMATW